jgi:hypothetical protein
MLMSDRSITMGMCFILCALLIGGGGCSNYYKVRDPQTGRVYYTDNLKERNGGAVTLKDGKTGDEVTIQNSEVQKINKDRYETARVTSGQNPELEAQKEAARVAEQKAQEEAAEARAAEARAAEQRAAADARAAEAKAAELKSGEVKTSPDGKSADAAAAAGTSAEPEAALAGASAAGGAAAAKQAVTPEQLRKNLVAGKDQVDRTLQSLSQLTDPNTGDLQTAYKNYGTQVDRMKQHAAQTKVDADAMRQTREAYFAKWDQRISQTDNPTIRAEAEATRARLRSGQDKLIADSALAKEAYDPFITDLEDVRKFLANDVTKDAISVLSPTAKKAQENGKLLKQRIDTLVADLDSIEGKPTTHPSGVSAGAGASGTISTPSAAPQQD